nr:NADH dehydrogenase subunit 2 [Benthodytes sp. Gxx-2023]
MNRSIFIFLLLCLLSGTLIVIFSSHWFPIWMGLELSTLSILPLLSTNFISRNNEAILKYFLVQAFSAALLLNGAILNLWLTNSWDINFTEGLLPHSIISLALIIKLGLAPCHFWFPDVLSGVTFLEGLLIACWQKIAPFFLILSLNSSIINEILLVSSIISVIIGGWGGLNQTSIRKILAYSSISHIGWILAASFFSQNAGLALFTLYLLFNTLIFLLCHSINIKSISFLNIVSLSPTNVILFLVSILSLGGLPPLGGFLNKLIPLIIFSNNSNIIIATPFLIGSLLSLFFYLRLTFNSSLILFPQHSINLINWRSHNFNNTLFTSILFSFTLFGLLLFPIIYSLI